MNIAPIGTLGLGVALLLGCSNSDATSNGSTADASLPMTTTSGRGGGDATGGSVGNSGGRAGSGNGATGGEVTASGGSSGGIEGTGGLGGFIVVPFPQLDAAVQGCQGHPLSPDPPLVRCSLDLTPSIPDGMSIHWDQINVWYGTGSEPATAVPRISTPGDCALNQDEAWYFDNPVSPTQILLCPGACLHGATATFQVLVGCATIPGN